MTTPVAVSSGAVYRGVPINEFPEFAITVLDKGNFVVGYCDDFRNPAWVSYHVGPATDFRNFPSPAFRTDASTAARVRDGDYTNSGFDRGHMAPKFALGSRFGAEGARSTFIMSNVAPQYHTLNDGQWGDLEEWIAGRKPPNATAATFIRGWADELGGVWVTVGPLFEEERDALPAGVPVPSGFFSIVVDEQANGQPRALAFIMPHVDERVDSLTGFLKSIDEVETRAGLDFFHELPNSVEDALERSVATELWPLPVAPN
jgi:endonuclease G